MDILYLLIPLSTVLVLLVGVVFWFALSSGQFDDLDGPALNVVADDDRPAVVAAATPAAATPTDDAAGI